MLFSSAPVNRYFIPRWFDNLPQFLCIFWFCLRNSIFDVSSQVSYWIKVQALDWPLHNLNILGLEPRCCLLTRVWVIVLLQHPLQGFFLFSMRQQDLSKYFDVRKWIYDPWYAINWPNNIVRETAQYYDACTTMLDGLQNVLWLKFSFAGSCDKLSLALGPKMNNFTLTIHTVHKMYFSISLQVSRYVLWQIVYSSAFPFFFNCC